MTNLQPLTVLVTRPGPSGLALCERIESQGGHAVYFPTIVFTPLANSTQFQESVKRLGEQDWLIFISPQAVCASISTIQKRWPHFPPQIKLAAVGAGTAKALKQAGYATIVYPQTAWGSQGLLELPEFQHITGHKIAIIRGEGGRDLLEHILLQRGASVLHVIAYERALPVVHHLHAYLDLLKQEKINRIVAASFEGVKNLKILLGEEGWSCINKIPLIVVSERIKLLAHDLGFQTIWVAANAGHGAMLDMIFKKE